MIRSERQKIQGGDGGCVTREQQRRRLKRSEACMQVRTPGQAAVKLL